MNIASKSPKSLNLVLRIMIGIIAISISAQLTISVGDIPVTGQTLSILIIALLLQPKDTFFVLLGYLILGGSGLPIFADGASGIDKFTGGSGGFLIGFIFSSTFISYLFQRSKSKDWKDILMLTLLGTVIILIFGVGRLSMLWARYGNTIWVHTFLEGCHIKSIARYVYHFHHIKIQKKPLRKQLNSSSFKSILTQKKTFVSFTLLSRKRYYSI